MKKIKVLIITSEHFLTQKSPLSGIFQWHQAKALVENGYEVTVLSFGLTPFKYFFKKYPYIAEERLEGVNIYRKYKRTPVPGRFISIRVLKKISEKIGLELFKKYIEDHGFPDLIHAHNVVCAGFLASAIKKKFGIPFVLTEHSSAFIRGTIRKNEKKIIKKCLMESDHLSAVSSTFVSFLNSYFQLSHLQFSLLPNLLEDFFSCDSKRQEKKQITPFVFLTIGSLDQNKNHSLLIQAFAKFFKDKPARLRIGGSGNLRVYLEKLTQELGVKEKVDFLGHLSREQVKSEMENADCFVLSSVVETFGVVLIEALACGLPLISTSSGGPADIINESNGILVEYNDVQALGNAMTIIFENEKFYSSDRLREDAITRFGEEAFISRISTIYHSVLD